MHTAAAPGGCTGAGKLAAGVGMGCSKVGMGEGKGYGLR